MKFSTLGVTIVVIIHAQYNKMKKNTRFKGFVILFNFQNTKNYSLRISHIFDVAAENVHDDGHILQSAKCREKLSI